MNDESCFEICPSPQSNPHQTRAAKLLVSVRDSQETLAALAGGADWIDLKEPSAGPLAAVDREVAAEAVKILGGRRVMSAALGELRDWHKCPTDDLLSVPGLSVVKLGLAGCARLRDWQSRWQAVAIAAQKADKQLAAVIYADWQSAQAPAPPEVVSMATAAGSHFLLIDTFDKSIGSTFDHFSPNALAELLLQAKQAMLTTVLAGSMTTERLHQLPLGTLRLVDIVAIRGAACQGGRTAQVQASLVRNFRNALHARAADSQAPAEALP